MIPKPIITNMTRRYRVHELKIAGLYQAASQLLNVEDYLVNITFTGTQAIRRLNREYRGKDRATDVLSFPQIMWKIPLSVTKPKKKKDRVIPEVLGDLVICLDIAKKNADHIGQGLDREVFFLMVHGLLHLCGHDHVKDAEEKIMLKMQNKIINSISGRSTPPMWKGCVTLKRATYAR